MGIDPDSIVEARDFSGMLSNYDPTDLKPGQARLQINLLILRRGELLVRRGLRELTFDADDT